MASISIASRYGACGLVSARIADGYRLDSKLIFSQLARPLFTGAHANRVRGSLKEQPVNQSLRAIEVDTRTPEWRKRPLARSRSQLSSRHCCTGGLSRSGYTGLIELLAARYPATRRLAGELSFRVVARRFILSGPPAALTPKTFGDNFPCFIRSLGSAACIEYVADVAELEMLQWKARYVPHVQSLAAVALSSLQTERLNGLCVAWHPSVCLVQSRFPIVTAWENHQTSDDPGTIERWVADAAVVARPVLEVEVRRVPPGGYAFLRALSEGKNRGNGGRDRPQLLPNSMRPPSLG